MLFKPGEGDSKVSKHIFFVEHGPKRGCFSLDILCMPVLSRIHFSCMHNCRLAREAAAKTFLFFMSEKDACGLRGFRSLLSLREEEQRTAFPRTHTRVRRI